MSSTQEAGDIFGKGGGPAHAMLRSPTVLIASIGLWGMNIFFYRLFGIDYVKVLKYDLLNIDQAEQQKLQHHQYFEEGIQLQQIHEANVSTPSPPRKNALMRERSGDGTGTMGLKKESISAASSMENYSDEEGEDVDEASVVSAEGTDAAAPTAVTWGRLVGFSMALLLLLHFTYFWWISVLGGSLPGAVFAFYGSVVFVCSIPFRATRWVRKGTRIVFLRLFELFNPRCHCLASDTQSAPSMAAGGSNSDGDNGSSSASKDKDKDVTSTQPYIARPVPFVDVFFADALCSLSKVFFDWGMLLLMISYGGRSIPKTTYNILVPSAFASVPFFLRARQCLLMYGIGRVKNEKDRFNHLWNALKYSTSIFPLCLSAYQKTLPRQREKDLEIYLILLLLINSSFALYWDVVMDWGMCTVNPIARTLCGAAPPQSSPVTVTHLHHHQVSHHSYLGGKANRLMGWQSWLRPQLRFGVAMSAVILFTDIVLRFSWTLRFYDKLFPSQDSFVLCTQFIEVFRRALWNLLRVEWENLKQLKKAGALTGRSIPAVAPASGGIALEGEMTSFLMNSNGKINVL